jgi:hypothetical protein
MKKRNKSPIGGKFAATRRTVGPRGRRRWVAASAGLATIAAVFGLQPATSFAKGGGGTARPPANTPPPPTQAFPSLPAPQLTAGGAVLLDLDQLKISGPGGRDQADSSRGRR